MHFSAARRESTPTKFEEAMRDWRQSANDQWFDGTVASVDRRLRRCARLMSVAHQLMARDPGSVEHMTAVRDLSADRAALADLRERLLTGGSGREAGVSPPGRTAAAKGKKKTSPRLTEGEQVWLEVEAARFMRENADAAHVPDELQTRARNHAEYHTSKLGLRSRVLTSAFVDRVLDLSRRVPRPRTVTAAAPAAPDFADAMLFLG